MRFSVCSFLQSVCQRKPATLRTEYGTSAMKTLSDVGVCSKFYGSTHNLANTTPFDFRRVRREVVTVAVNKFGSTVFYSKGERVSESVSTQPRVAPASSRSRLDARRDACPSHQPPSSAVAGDLPG
jgi:hypothetical protein